jgi:carbamoyl-phosphate synthase large subunit
VARSLNVLLTCIGRRVALLEAFRRALVRLRVKGLLYGADSSACAAAWHRADRGLLVPPVQDPAYADELLAACRRHGIGMVIPLLDWELPVLAEARERFAAAGTRLVISSPRVVKICRDKQLTFEFLKSHGFDTPEVLPYAKARRGPFPLFIKPQYGSNAKNVHKVENARALALYHEGRGKSVIQEYLKGDEYTVDVYAGLQDGVPRVAVPRKRLSVRGGEVVKARTVRHAGIIEQSLALVKALGECVGVITIQCFLTPKGRIAFIEINPRFGGGVPLAIEAGADFPRWLIQEHLGRRPRIRSGAWEDGLMMLRYDEAVFVEEASLSKEGRAVLPE